MTTMFRRLQLRHGLAWGVRPFKWSIVKDITLIAAIVAVFFLINRPPEIVIAPPKQNCIEPGQIKKLVFDYSKELRSVPR